LAAGLSEARRALRVARATGADCIPLATSPGTGQTRHTSTSSYASADQIKK
jgi:hypothetical protein